MAATQESNGSSNGSRKNWIHFRVTPDLRIGLDAIVDDLNAKGIPATRSSVARSMLQKSLGNDEIKAEISESLATVYHVVQRAMSRLVEDAKENIGEYLTEGLDKFYEDRPRGGVRQPEPGPRS